MPTLIDRDGRVDDRWVRMPEAVGSLAEQSQAAGATDGSASAAIGQGPIGSAVASPQGVSGGVDADGPADRLVAGSDWLARRDAWLALLQGADGRVRVGIELSPDEDPAAFAADLDRFSLIAIRFPRFTDGRGYSIARELRQLHGWRGHLRATGDVLRDQLFYLARCGFDQYELRDDQDVARAIAAFGDFSEAYQAAVDRGALFERRPGTDAVRA